MNFSKRHLAKAISWRITGTLDTLFFAWLITKNLDLGLSISGISIVTKMFFYYIHEQLWVKSNIHDANRRHLLKTFTWRIIGTIDTMLISTILTGNPLTALKIGFTETISKMVLYFAHEKLWYRINFGLDERKKKFKIL